MELRDRGKERGNQGRGGWTVEEGEEGRPLGLRGDSRGGNVGYEEREERGREKKGERGRANGQG